MKDQDPRRRQSAYELVSQRMLDPQFGRGLTGGVAEDTLIETLGMITHYRQRDLAVHILNGITQRIPNQHWNPEAQIVAVGIFSMINFDAMRLDESRPGLFLSVTDCYQATLDIPITDVNKGQSAMSLLTIGWHLMPYIEGDETRKRVIDKITQLALLVTNKDDMQTLEASGANKRPVFSEAEDVRQVFDTGETLTDRAQTLLRRLLTYLDSRMSTRDIAAHLQVAVSTVEEDLFWLHDNGYIQRESVMTPTQPQQTLVEAVETNADVVNLIREKTASNRYTSGRTDLMARRVIIFLNHVSSAKDLTAKELAIDLSESESTIEHDFKWLRDRGVVEKKPTGKQVSKRRRAVLTIADLGYDDIAKRLPGVKRNNVKEDIDRLRKDGHQIAPKKGGRRPSTELSKNAHIVMPFAHLSRKEIMDATALSFKQVQRARQELIREGYIESRKPQRQWTKKDRKTKTGVTVYQVQSTSK